MNSVWFYYSLIKTEFWKSKIMFFKKKFEHCSFTLFFLNDSYILFIDFSSKMALGMEGINKVLHLVVSELELSL